MSAAPMTPISSTTSSAMTSPQSPTRVEELEATIEQMLDPLAAPNMPAFDIAILLLFLSELEATPDLPVPVACKEAVALSLAFSGDEHGSHRHVNGLLAAFARERLGR